MTWKRPFKNSDRDRDAEHEIAKKHKLGERILYITVFDHKERTTRVYTRDNEIDTLYQNQMRPSLMSDTFYLKWKSTPKLIPKVTQYPVPGGDQPRSQPSKPNAQDLREQVEAAKRIYKAEKECYRQEREERRQERTAGRHTMRSSATYVQCFPKYFCAHQAYRVGSTPVTHAEIPRDNETSSIQLQGMYLEVERASAPRRHTHSGHRSFRCQDLTTRAVARITRKLADVGYGLSKSSMF